MHPPGSVTPQALPPSGIVLDVRTGVEHAGVSLKRAHHHVPLGDFDARKFLDRHKIGADSTVYTLCRSGKRATQAAEALVAAGHGSVKVIEGGIIACEAAGMPVRKGTVMSLERQVRIAAGLLVVLGVGFGAFLSPWFYALPAFVGGGLVFAGVTDSCGMGLVLSKCPWNKNAEAATAAAGPTACNAATPACAAGDAAASEFPDDMPEGISFYSPANGRPTPVQVYELTGKSGSGGGCS